MGMAITSWRGCSIVNERVQNIVLLLIPCSLCPLTSTSWANSQLLLSQWRSHHNLEVRFSLQNHFVWLLNRWCRWLHNRIHWSFCSWLGQVNRRMIYCRSNACGNETCYYTSVAIFLLTPLFKQRKQLFLSPLFAACVRTHNSPICNECQTQ